MKISYKVELNEDVIAVKNPEEFNPIRLNEAEIFWDISHNDILKSLNIVFNGVIINSFLYKEESPEDSILIVNREFYEKAFEIATYISNKIFLDTGIDGLNPRLVLDNSPTILPENKEEENIIEKSKKKSFNSIDVELTITKSLEFKNLQEDIVHYKAISLYAESKRTKNDIQKYELLYKIIEYFFPDNKGDKLDKCVIKYCGEHNMNYESEDFIKSIRILRNRCVHPNSKGYISIEKIRDIEEVEKQLPKIEELVNLLLNHPPF